MIFKNQRNTNIEILRIISILFILFFHFLVFDLDKFHYTFSNPNMYVVYFLGILGKLGVDIFILISAYYMIESTFTIKKLFKLCGAIYFYSFIFFVMAIIIITPAHMSISDFGQGLLPISHSAYWFMTCYIILMLFSPYLNKLIKGLSKKSFSKIVLLSLFLWSIVPTIIPPMTSYPVQNIFVGNNFQYSQLIWFFVLYLVGSYIRLYFNLDKISNKKLIGGFIISIIISFIGNCYFGMMDFNTSTNYWWSLPMFGVMEGSIGFSFSLENKFFIMTAAICLLLIFLKRKKFSNKYINYIAGSAFGVYLIHDNLFFRQILWGHLGINSFYNSPYFILIIIGVVLGIYITCTFIDILRRSTIEKVWIYIIDNKLNFISNWIERINDSFNEKFS